MRSLLYPSHPTLAEHWIVPDNHVRRSTRVVPNEMNLLSREEDRPIFTHRLFRGEIFLPTRNGPFEGRLPTAVDPDRQVEVSPVGSLEEVNSFQDDDVQV